MRRVLIKSGDYTQSRRRPRRPAGRRPAAPRYTPLAHPAPFLRPALSMPQETFITRGLRVRDRGRMPHWEAAGSSYFVTFRLRDSLPIEVIGRLKEERAQLLAKANTAAERLEAHRAFGMRLDTFLDKGYGSE